jgi:hypothetical protein
MKHLENPASAEVGARAERNVFEFYECGHLDAEPARMTRAFNKEADAIAEALSNAMLNIGS